MTFKYAAIATSLAMLILPAMNGNRKTSDKPQQIAASAVVETSPGTSSCDGVNLGIKFKDTVNYQTGFSGILPLTLILNMPVVGDQGAQGSCAAWATVYAAGNYYIHSTSGRRYSDSGNLSPRFVYNQISQGNCTCTSILDNLYLLKTQGACSMADMPYDANDCSTQPDSIQRVNAASYKINGWQKIDVHDINLLKSAIYDQKPVIFTINIDENFRSIQEPYIWAEKSNNSIQAHSMVISGYDDTKKAFKVMNSWGLCWGEDGFAWIDYDLFTNYAFEGAYVIN